MKKRFFLSVSVFSSVILGAAVLAWTTFSQDAHVAAANSCLSIPASAFQTQNELTDFYRTASLTSRSNDAWFYAPVNLPHGSTIKKIMLICTDDNATKSVQLNLYRQTTTHNSTKLASCYSSGQSSEWRTFTTTSISPRYVNNFRNSYYLTLYLPGTSTDGYSFSQVKIYFDAP